MPSMYIFSRDGNGIGDVGWNQMYNLLLTELNIPFLSGSLDLIDYENFGWFLLEQISAYIHTKALTLIFF